MSLRTQSLPPPSRPPRAPRTPRAFFSASTARAIPGARQALDRLALLVAGPGLAEVQAVALDQVQSVAAAAASRRRSRAATRNSARRSAVAISASVAAGPGPRSARPVSVSAAQASFRSRSPAASARSAAGRRPRAARDPGAAPRRRPPAPAAGLLLDELQVAQQVVHPRLVRVSRQQLQQHAPGPRPGGRGSWPPPPGCSGSCAADATALGGGRRRCHGAGPVAQRRHDHQRQHHPSTTPAIGRPAPELARAAARTAPAARRRWPGPAPAPRRARVTASAASAWGTTAISRLSSAGQELASGLEALGLVLLQRLMTAASSAAGSANVGCRLGERGQRGGHLHGQDPREVLGDERLPTGQQLVQHHPAGIDVGPGVHVLGRWPARATCSWGCRTPWPPGSGAARPRPGSWVILAMPKSRILTTSSLCSAAGLARVNMTLAGFRSRCTTPWAWAWARACQHLADDEQRPRTGQPLGHLDAHRPGSARARTPSPGRTRRWPPGRSR